MTALMYTSCAAGAVLLAVYIALCRKERCVKGLFVKSFVSVSYLLAGAFAILSNPDSLFYGLPIIIAGVLGLKGDIYLDQKWMYDEHKDNYLRIGFICFGLGHFFYMWSLHQKVELTAIEHLIPVAGGIFMVAFNLIMEKPTKQDFGKFRPFVSIYALVLGYTTALSVLIYIKTDALFALIFALGCVSFMVSDLELSQMYFCKGKNNSVRFTINIITYYLAQFLIAITPAFVK